MRMVRMNIQLPEQIKAKLDALRTEGITASGLIRRLLNDIEIQNANQPTPNPDDNAPGA